MRGAHAVVVLMSLSAAILFTAALPAGARGQKFTVTSPAFAHGAKIPVRFTCDGAGVSIPLSWRHAPKGAEELAVIMDDPDAPTGVFVHWVAWGIEPAARKLAKGAAPKGFEEGKGYLGPCPPRGDSPHRYRITMYALDAPPAVTAGSTTALDLRAAIHGHVLARARMVGRYAR
jgi:Raf kinase inhibitor-like YbhB/YbcL family protein